jgi:hypothetical protein
VGLERGPLSLVSTIEELYESKSSGSVLVNREYGRRRSVTLISAYKFSSYLTVRTIQLPCIARNSDH